MTPRGRWVVARRAALVVVLGATALLLSGCSWSEVLGLGWPKGITPEAHINRELWIGSVIASLVVGVIVWGLIFWASAFHRHKKGDTELPRQFGYNMPLELVLTVVPFLIISVLFYFTVVVQEKMLHKEPNPEVVIDVTAFQWNWKFGYQKVDFTDGTFNYDGADPARKAPSHRVPKASRANTAGSSAHRGQEPRGPAYLNFDKVETLGNTRDPVLVVPSGKRIEFQIASADVVHGFWVPEFLFKRDVMPDPEPNNSDNVFQISEIQDRRVRRRCTEMCGTYHSMMNFELRVVEPNDFKAYLQQRIAGKTNAEALVAINQRRRRSPPIRSTPAAGSRRGTPRRASRD